MNKMDMSLDDIVKSARTKPEKEGKGGGKAKKDNKGRAAPPVKTIQKKKEDKPKPKRIAPPSESLFVGNLPFTTEAASLEAYLGTVASCKVELKVSGSGKPKGTAIVTFDDVASATKVMEGLAETEFEGRKLLIRFYSTAPEEKSDPAPKEKKVALPSASVYVGNLPFTTEAAALEAYLGTVAACTVEIKLRNNKKSAGFAIATFADVDAATKAVEGLTDTEFEGRKLLVRFDNSA